MSDTMTLIAEKRDRAGKGSARASRRAGLIPAVIYGDKKAPLSINLNANAFKKLVAQPGIMSQIINVKVGGSANTVLPRDIQFHPVTDVPLHVDFLRVAKGAKVEVMIAVEFINEADSPGLKTGGVLNVVRHEVELFCPADAIPDNIVADLTGTDHGDSIRISSIELPPGVEPTITDRDFIVATIAAPASDVIETTEEEGDEGEGEAE